MRGISSPSGLQPGQALALIGLAIGLFAMWVAPPVLGPAGMLLGVAATARGERRGRWVILVAAVAMGFGLLIDLLPERWVS